MVATQSGRDRCRKVVRKSRALARHRQGRRGSQRAFTLIELILVIVLLGTLSAVAGPRFFDGGAFEARRYQDELAAALRYAQKVAVASGCAVRVDIGATTYALNQQPASAGHCNAASGTFDVPVVLPTGEPMQGVAPASVTVSPAQTIVFDALGRTSLIADQTFVVGSRSILVRADSGLVTTP